MAAMRTHPCSVGRGAESSLALKCSKVANNKLATITSGGIGYSQRNCHARRGAAAMRRRINDASSSVCVNASASHRTAARPAHDVSCRVSTSSSSSSSSSFGAGGIVPATACVTVNINVHAELDYGQKLGMVGDAALLGGWNPQRPYMLKWTEGDVWTGTMELPAVGEIEYKLIITQHGDDTCEPEWEHFQGGNRVLDLLPGGSYLKIVGEFGEELEETRQTAPPAPKPKPPKPKPAIPAPPVPPPQVSLQAPDFTAPGYEEQGGGGGGGGGGRGDTSFQDRVQQALDAAQTASNAVGPPTAPVPPVHPFIDRLAWFIFAQVLLEASPRCTHTQNTTRVSYIQVRQTADCGWWRGRL